MSLADELKKLADLKADGALSDEEFDQLKQRLLGGEGADAAPMLTEASSQKPRGVRPAFLVASVALLFLGVVSILWLSNAARKLLDAPSPLSDLQDSLGEVAEAAGAAKTKRVGPAVSPPPPTPAPVSPPPRKQSTPAPVAVQDRKPVAPTYPKALGPVALPRSDRPRLRASELRARLSEAPTTLDAIRTAEKMYHAESGVFWTLPPCPPGRPGPGIRRFDAACSARWSEFGFTPDRPLRCTYSVVDIANAGEFQDHDFKLRATCDIDGDGEPALYEATRAEKSHRITGNDVF